VSLVSLPNVWTSGQTLYAAALNADFTACANGVNNITSAPTGIYASDVAPATSGEATFGGTTIYKFPTPLEVTVNSIASYVPPVFTVGGGAFASTLHGVTGSLACAVTGGQTSSGAIAVNLSGAAAFTNGTSYFVIATVEGQSTYAVGNSPGDVIAFTDGNNVRTGSKFYLGVSALAGTFTGSGNVTVDFIAIGY
jgi:hypothetical protein